METGGYFYGPFGQSEQPWSLEVLAKAMNSWTERAVVPATDLGAVYSPIGSDFFDHERKGLQQYPKEVGSLVASLARWRRAMRDNVALLQEPALK